MARLDNVLYLPLMCSALVLSIELWAKGAITAFILGASSLALFAFILAVLKYVGSMDDPQGEMTGRIDTSDDEIVFETIRIPARLFEEPAFAQSPR